MASQGRRSLRLRRWLCRLAAFGTVLAISLTGLAGMSAVAAHPLQQEPTARPTPTPAPTWTSSPTPTNTHTPVPPTNTPRTADPTPPRPTSTEEPTETDEPTRTRTPTVTATHTPGLTPVTPIIESTAVPIYIDTSVPSYGTRLPVSGVEMTPTPIVLRTVGTPPPVHTPTPVPPPTHAPTPTVTPTPTPSDRLGPAAPAGLVATAGNGVVVLEWTTGQEEDLDGYRVYRSSAQGSGYSKMVSVSRKVARYVDNTVTNSVTYYYVVSAFDMAGNESPYSKEVSITPSALKGMPGSGSTLAEIVLTSLWFWAALLAAVLAFLLGVRRSGGETAA